MCIRDSAGASFAKFYEDGNIKINAGSGNVIVLTSRDSNDAPNPELEPYVLVSQLESFVQDLVVILNVMNAAIVTAATSTIPTVGAVQSAINGQITAPGGTVEKTTALFSDYVAPQAPKTFRSSKIFGE